MWCRTAPYQRYEIAKPASGTVPRTKACKAHASVSEYCRGEKERRTIVHRMGKRYIIDIHWKVKRRFENCRKLYTRCLQKVCRKSWKCKVRNEKDKRTPCQGIVENPCRMTPCTFQVAFPETVQASVPARNRAIAGIWIHYGEEARWTCSQRSATDFSLILFPRTWFPMSCRFPYPARNSPIIKLHRVIG